jgi:hypothetical protein
LSTNIDVLRVPGDARLLHVEREREKTLTRITGLIVIVRRRRGLLGMR